VLLGVQPTATTKEIKRAYRKLALALHPDVNLGPDAAAQFKELAAAYQTLINPKRRAVYDQMREAVKQGRIPVRYNPSGGPVPGATGEYFQWNAAYYSAWASQQAAPPSTAASHPPPVNSLADVLVAFGHNLIVWMLVLTVAMGIGAVVWWEGSAAGRSGIVTGMIGCMAVLSFLFHREMCRYRATIQSRFAGFVQGGAFALGLAAVFAAMVLGGLTLTQVIEPLEAWIQGAAALIVGFTGMRWFVLTGRRYKERHPSG
jgi:hypothetical protein